MCRIETNLIPYMKCTYICSRKAKDSFKNKTKTNQKIFSVNFKALKDIPLSSLLNKIEN